MSYYEQDVRTVKSLAEYSYLCGRSAIDCEDHNPLERQELNRWLSAPGAPSCYKDVVRAEQDYQKCRSGYRFFHNEFGNCDPYFTASLKTAENCAGSIFQSKLDSM